MVISRLTHRNVLLLALVTTAIAATACGSSNGPASPGPTETPASTSTPGPTSTPAPSPTTEPLPTPALDIDALQELNPRPELRSIDRSIDFGFDEREALPRDSINPVYSPKFVTPDEVQELMIEDELVMGLSIGGETRAYPVGIMRFREMVNDEVGGIPLLVTW